LIERKTTAWAAAAMLLACATAPAQQRWQHLQNPTAAQVGEQWRDPPPEYGPEPYYGLNGPVSLAQLERDLDTLHGLGFQAVTVQAGFNMPFAYLSPEYFAFFRKFVEAAKQRNMRVWIVDDAGYPSGFAGGKFTSEKPALRMQALEVVERIPVEGGAALHRELLPDIVSAAAVDENGAEIPLRLRSRRLDWTAPPGKWTVLLVDHEFRTSPTRSDTNPKRVKDTEQSLEDYLDPAATRQYLQFTHQQYKHYVGDEFGKTIMGFRGDEPDYSIAGLPWTPKFFARFIAIKGYDVQPYAALFAFSPSRRDAGFAIHLTPEQLRIKADYYDVFSLMFAEGFFRPQGAWCAANHLEYQVHLNHEEMEMDLTHSEGSFFRDMRAVEVPGIDAIWHQIWTDTISDYPRLASSVAHVDGRPRAFTESFAAYRPAPDVTMARYILNEQFVRGVNLVEMMYFPATSAGPRPPPGYMGQPGFADLAKYVQRMSYVMAMGRPDATVALYLPSSSMWMGGEVSDEQFVSTERLLSEHQIDFDIVDEDALESGLKAQSGALETLSGNRYRTVILPAPQVISATMLARLKAFAQGGGKVLFIGGMPHWIAGRTFRYAREAAAREFAWAKVVDATLPSTPTPPADAPLAPPGLQDIPPEWLAVLNAAVTAPTLKMDEADTALRVMKRTWADADVYLFFNESAHPCRHSVTLMSRRRFVERWNPQKGTVERASATLDGGHPEIQLDLRPYEAQLVVVQ
jgi:glycosyl hydrolase family 106( putative alpha-L-rhamnosidase)